MARRCGRNARVRSAQMESDRMVAFHIDPHGHGFHFGPSLATLAPGILTLRGVAIALCSEERR